MEGGGNCSLCGSPHTTKRTCPLNPLAKNKNKAKHPKSRKNVSFSTSNIVKEYKPFTKTEKKKLFLTAKQKKTIKQRESVKRKICPKNSHYDPAACPYKMKRCFNPEKARCFPDKNMSSLSPSNLPALSPDSANEQHYRLSTKGRSRAVSRANREWNL
jgi:hypothetical protein